MKARGWPANLAAAALRIVAADPATRSPIRLAAAGPWWDQAASTAASPRAAGERLAEDPADMPLAQLEAELADTDGLRVHLQAEARRLLRAQGKPVTRATVLRRAHQLLLAQRPQTAAAL